MSIEDLLSRGELFPDYAPEAQLAAIHGLIEQVYSWRNELSAEIKEPTIGGPYAGDIYVELCTSYTYRDAACSHAAVGALAPFFEGMFQHEFAYLRLLHGARPPVNQHIRWRMKPSDFWTSCMAVDNEDRPRKLGIAKGSPQLLEALGLDDRFPIGHPRILAALFAFRNESLHNGYEWPKQKRMRFQTTMQQKGWNDWFTWSKSGDELWGCTLRDSFVKVILKLAERAIRAFNEIGEEWLNRASSEGHQDVD